MRHFNLRRRSALGVSLLALATALPVMATAAETNVEELVVTARKRDEQLIDVPFSINALSETKMRERGATNLEDLSRNIAGFTVQNLGPGQSQVAIRGISAGQLVRDQPGVKEQVGVYLDESVISLSLFTPDLDLFDLNRLEVLRGPQGTLFGSGSLSGTVRYITNQPELGAFHATLEGTASQISEGGTGGDVKAWSTCPWATSRPCASSPMARSSPAISTRSAPAGSPRTTSTTASAPASASPCAWSRPRTSPSRRATSSRMSACTASTASTCSTSWPTPTRPPGPR